MLAWELDRVEMGESVEGEKYEGPANSPGEAVADETFVFKLKGGAW